MRERLAPPISEVVHTDDEIKAAMKAENATAKQISAAIDERQANATAIQADYDTNGAAKFEASLQKQNQV